MDNNVNNLNELGEAPVVPNLSLKQIIMANLDNNLAVKDDVLPIHNLFETDEYDYLGYSTFISKTVFEFYRALYTLQYDVAIYNLHKLYFDISLFFLSPLKLGEDGVESSDFVNHHINKTDLYMGMYSFCDYELRANLQRIEHTVLNKILIDTFDMLKSDYYSSDVKLIKEFPYIIPVNESLNKIKEYLTEKGIINISPNLAPKK